MSRRCKRAFRTFIKLSLFACGGMYAINRYIAKQAEEKGTLKKSMGHIYPWNKGDIYYHVSGTGSRNLLLIHDAASYASSYEWNEVEALLQNDFTVYTIDLIGCGRSDKPALIYTNYMYVQLITDFIENVIGEPAEVAATGLSASFAVMAAFAKPELITRLSMINPWSPKKLAEVPDYRSKVLGSVMAIPVLGTTVYNLLNSRSNLSYILDEKCFYNPFKVRAKLLNACYTSAHIGKNGSGRYMLASLDGKYLNWNINRAVSSLTQPVFIIYGDKMSRGAQTAKAYRRLNKGITLQSVSVSRMFPQLEEPQQVADYLID